MTDGIQRKLTETLRTVKNDEEYISGISLLLKTDKEAAYVITFIQENPNINPGLVVKLGILIKQKNSEIMESLAAFPFSE